MLKRMDKLRRSSLLAIVALGIIIVSAQPVEAQWQNLKGRFALHANVAFQAGSYEFRQLFNKRIYGEDANLSAEHKIRGGAILDLGGSVNVWEDLAVGGAYTDFKKADITYIVGSVPHPILFDSDRILNVDAQTFPHRERAGHIYVSWRLPTDQWSIRQLQEMDISVFGGPSYFSLTQGLVADIGLVEATGPPFSEVSVAPVSIGEYSKSGWGGHVGADFTYMFTSTIGVGAVLRFSKGTVDIPSSDGIVSISVGGFQSGAGIRLKF